MTRILIVRLGALGDIIHALPAATAIRKALPDAVLGWMVEERWSELLTARGEKPSPLATGSQKPVVNLVHTVDTMRWRKKFFRATTAREIAGDLGRLRQTHYDLALDFQGNMKSALFATLSRARVTAGFHNPRERGARWFYSRRFARSGEHVIEQNLSLADEALRPWLQEKRLETTAPLLPCDPAAESWACAEIKKLGIASFAIMNPGAGWGGKQWPAERFGEVARALAVHNVKTLVNSGPGEEALAAAVVEASAGHASSIVCTLGQLIALVRRARLLIGGDTGPLHLAAALGIPVVGIYGPTDPARTGPVGSPAIALRHAESETTFSHHAAPDQGLLQISTEEVISAARYLLGNARG
ncbi:MAG TPA: glycosyltransferase family 9 protein [Terriglobales bacterium]|nr:glycosyltransferase family 9 protein [Terriglobales bacterium]